MNVVVQHRITDPEKFASMDAEEDSTTRTASAFARKPKEDSPMTPPAWQARRAKRVVS
jgi:hypothetical protein